MHIIQHSHLPHLQLPGELCVCAADSRCGVGGFEVWLRTLEPGAHTPALVHCGELVVLSLTGAGKLVVDGGPQRFQGPCTLLVPAGLTFELANRGAASLKLVWVFTVPPTLA